MAFGARAAGVATVRTRRASSLRRAPRAAAAARAAVMWEAVVPEGQGWAAAAMEMVAVGQTALDAAVEATAAEAAGEGVQVARSAAAKAHIRASSGGAWSCWRGGR